MINFMIHLHRTTTFAALIALAGVTGATAGETILPFSNLQPALALNEVTLFNGIFPGGGGSGAVGDELGFVYDFAGEFAPGGSTLAAGQTLAISQNVAQYIVLGGTTYGGDGRTTIRLPNLTDRLVIGAGSGAGLSTRNLGDAPGAAVVSLTPAQLPGSGGLPFGNVQPSLTLQTLIATNGAYPFAGSSGGTSTFIGQIANFAGPIVPAGWAAADGRLLSIDSNPALFSVIGTTYGGNGTTNFALPDLQGRVAVGADSARPIGTAFGQEATTLTAAQVPPGGSSPVNDDQPSLSIRYLIADRGIYPSQGAASGGFDATNPTLGQVVAFAGDYIPAGYVAADGSLLSIASNPALFSLLGTTYGGDGRFDFALPNLDGRAVIGAGGAYMPGDRIGADRIALVGLPTGVPEPAAWSLMLLGFGLIGGACRRRFAGRSAAG